MPAKLSTPRDRTPPTTTLLGPIVPAALWTALTPAQQQHLRETLALIGQEWLATMSPREDADHE
jgi:hypothetical protein